MAQPCPAYSYTGDLAASVLDCALVPVPTHTDAYTDASSIALALSSLLTIVQCNTFHATDVPESCATNYVQNAFGDDQNAFDDVQNAFYDMLGTMGDNRGLTGDLGSPRVTSKRKRYPPPMARLQPHLHQITQGDVSEYLRGRAIAVREHMGYLGNAPITPTAQKMRSVRSVPRVERFRFDCI